MKFREIARFLNISETVARLLGKQEMLPGRMCADGWETTFDELERWYVKLSGKEWANLVADGQVDSLIAEVDLEGEVAGEALLTVLSSWEQRGIRTGRRVSATYLSTLNQKASVGKSCCPPLSGASE